VACFVAVGGVVTTSLAVALRARAAYVVNMLWTLWECTTSAHRAVSVGNYSSWLLMRGMW